jgi:hypothetical protein
MTSSLIFYSITGNESLEGVIFPDKQLVIKSINNLGFVGSLNYKFGLYIISELQKVANCWAKGKLLIIKGFGTFIENPGYKLVISPYEDLISKVFIVVWKKLIVIGILLLSNSYLIIIHTFWFFTYTGKNCPGYKPLIFLLNVWGFNNISCSRSNQS